MSGIFATFAEFERDLIKRRTVAGLAPARARGRAKGRRRPMTRAKLRTAMTMMAERSNERAGTRLRPLRDPTMSDDEI